MAVVVIATGFISCGDDNDDPQPNPADKSALTALIAECETLVNDQDVAGDYPAAAITEFQAVIATAKQVAASEGAAQAAVDNAVLNLTAARDAFLAKAYGAIPEGALLLGLSFDNVADNAASITAAGKGLVAELKAGDSEIYGADTHLPQFVAGKLGNAAKLEKGAHFEIPTYSAADFRSKTLSVAVWVKPEATTPGNYIISFNYWNSWKFNLQDQAKPFFTVKTELGHVDADNEADNSGEAGKWTHLAVSLDLNAHTLAFYVNGQLTRTWDDNSKPNLAGSSIDAYATQLPIFIGASTSYAEANAAWDWTWDRTPEWWTANNCFQGLLDELKVYSIALTAGQVAKLYKDENK